jgi:hypothetical protein
MHGMEIIDKCVEYKSRLPLYYFYLHMYCTQLHCTPVVSCVKDTQKVNSN